jgi:hypothetical protein
MLELTDPRKPMSSAVDFGVELTRPEVQAERLALLRPLADSFAVRA